MDKIHNFSYRQYLIPLTLVSMPNLPRDISYPYPPRRLLVSALWGRDPSGTYRRYAVKQLRQDKAAIEERAQTDGWTELSWRAGPPAT